ncbi:BrnA antitoxin family protein [Gluconobacter albidus]|uniref:BrnA antitoxin family protein n=1 Tax=Gluconobacter albidus TaxID=318683 RepID=UPI0038CD73DE
MRQSCAAAVWSTRTQSSRSLWWLDADILEAFQRQGSDWETRINEALKAALSHETVR